MKTCKDSHSLSLDLNVGHPKHKALNCDIQWLDDDDYDDYDGGFDEKMIRFEWAAIMKPVTKKTGMMITATKKVVMIM
jgi:hypothetical protein